MRLTSIIVASSLLAGTSVAALTAEAGNIGIGVAVSDVQPGPAAPTSGDAAEKPAKGFTGKRIPPEETRKEFWTPERYKNAKPAPLPMSHEEAATLSRDQLAPQEPEEMEPSEVRPGKAPTTDVKFDWNNLLYEPDPIEESDATHDESKYQNVGTAGAQFSSSRLFPSAAYAAFPFKAIGKLFYTQPGVGEFVCSASVIRRRVIVTAGHCVHEGDASPKGWHTNLRFVPAYQNGVAPQGTWRPTLMMTTNNWFNHGKEGPPNAGDYALLEIGDQAIGGATKRIGDVTGWLGFKTNALRPNHAHLVGYPQNLDRGELMHWVASQSFGSAANKNVLYGSDMAGGSSGGPWIQNLGVPSVGQTQGSNTAPDAVIAVTSFGAGGGQLIQGASLFDSQFSSMMTAMCNRRSDNCQ